MIRPIWRPPRVYVPRCRWRPRRPILNMALGDRLVSAAGDWIVGPDGNKRVSDGTDSCGDPCNCASGTTNTECLTCTPDHVQVVFSGISVCSGCVNFVSSTGFYAKLTTGSPNTTFCLPQVGASSWQLVTSALQISDYTDASCTILNRVYDATITYQRFSGLVVLRIQPSYYLFDYGGTAGTPGDCIEASAINNTRTNANGFSCGDGGLTMGLGGSATVEACC